jgi:GNAT superfamily N-acetyltransferase
MGDIMQLREAIPEDFDRWLRLWIGYNEFYGRIGANALPSEITATTWARFFDPDEPMYALVAELGGELVGFANYLFHRSTTSIAPICYLQDLFTSEASRGRGVASALIDRVADHARREACPRVYWQTHESNETARRLYEKIAERSGFIVYRKNV